MANRVFVAAVIVLWLGSMSWLMVDKILPTYYDGQAPLAAGFETNVHVAWKVSWGGRPVGHAASIRLQGVANTTTLENRVVLEDVPLLDLVPALMRQVVGEMGRMKLDARTTLEFDSLDNFANFHSRVSINDISPVLQLNGEVTGGYLELKVEFNGVTYSPHVPIPDQQALSESLFPDAKLPYMYVGKRWEEEVYSPFRSPSSPIETVEVEVTGIERVEYDGELVRAMRVEFRASPDPGVPEEARLQAVTWVRAEDGLAVRHDVMIASSKLRFERLPEEEAAEVGRKLLAQPPQRHFGRRGGKGGRHPGSHGEWRGRPHDRRPAESSSEPAPDARQVAP
jgi:hypothetical protein